MRFPKWAASTAILTKPHISANVYILQIKSDKGLKRVDFRASIFTFRAGFLPEGIKSGTEEGG